MTKEKKTSVAFKIIWFSYKYFQISKSVDESLKTKWKNGSSDKKEIICSLMNGAI